MSKVVRGPEFQIESDKAMIVLGHSERKEYGEFIASALDERRVFEDIDVYTLNHCAAYLGRKSVREAMKSRTVITHSAGIMRVPQALQIIAINPPEPVSFGQLLRRATEVAKNPVVAEEGAPKTGIGDLAKAGFELVRSPIASATTCLRIARGYSATAHLATGHNAFRAGRAMVHSELDSFGFAELADMERAAMAGVTTVLLADHYHNEVFFAPRSTLDLLTPEILV